MPLLNKPTCSFDSLNASPKFQISSLVSRKKVNCVDCKQHLSKIDVLHDVVKSVQQEKHVTLNESIANEASLTDIQSKSKLTKQELSKANAKIKFMSPKIKNHAYQLLQKDKQISSLSESEPLLQSKLLKIKKRIKLLKQENNRLQSDVAKHDFDNSYDNQKIFDISLKEGNKNAYSQDVRKAAISLQCNAGVAAGNVKKVIDIVSRKVFHHSFSENYLVVRLL